MGAPILNWIFRFVVTASTLAGAMVLVRLPVPAAWRIAGLVAGAAAGAWLLFRFVPAFDPLGRVHWRLPVRSGGRACALTFDDGPGPDTLKVLEILAAEGVRATFFVLGANVARHAEAVRRMQAAGHVVGLHGMTHGRLSGATAAEVGRQIDDGRRALAEIGVTAAPVYRAPHGLKSAAVFEAARERGVAVWAWSRGVWDTSRPAPGVIVERATRWARPGMVLLLHDGRGEEIGPDTSAMLSALPGVIAGLRSRGFDFVTLPLPAGGGASRNVAVS